MGGEASRGGGNDGGRRGAGRGGGWGRPRRGALREGPEVVAEVPELMVGECLGVASRPRECVPRAFDVVDLVDAWWEREGMALARAGFRRLGRRRRRVRHRGNQ